MAEQYWKTSDVVLNCCTTLCMVHSEHELLFLLPCSLRSHIWLLEGETKQPPTASLAVISAELDKTRYCTLARQYVGCRTSSVSRSLFVSVTKSLRLSYITNALPVQSLHHLMLLTTAFILEYMSCIYNIVCL